MAPSSMTRRILRWSPLALSGLLLLGGGGALGLSLTGQDADRAEVEALVEQRQADADAAQQSFDEALEKLMAGASQAKPSRVAADAESGREAVESALAGKTSDKTLKGLSSLGPASGEMSVSVTGVSGVQYSYAASLLLKDGRSVLVTWTTEPDGSRDSVEAHVSDGPAVLSEPPGQEQAEDEG